MCHKRKTAFIIAGIANYEPIRQKGEQQKLFSKLLSRQEGHPDKKPSKLQQSLAKLGPSNAQYLRKNERKKLEEVLIKEEALVSPEQPRICKSAGVGEEGK